MGQPMAQGPAGSSPVLTKQPRVGKPPGVVVGGILRVAVGAPRKLTSCMGWAGEKQEPNVKAGLKNANDIHLLHKLQVLL